MHRLVIVLALGLILAGPAAAVRIRSQRGWMPPTAPSLRAKGWRLRTFRSEKARARVGYYVYLPSGYRVDKLKRYPVIYWLHGRNGTPSAAEPVRALLAAGIRAGTAPETILVSCTSPTGSSMWTDSKDGNTPVETVIVRELIPHVDATFRTIARREARAVEGYSMGGYGAAVLGFKYPDLFGAVSILSGALHTPESLQARRAEIFRDVFGGDADYARARSPWQLVRAHADKLRGRTAVRIHVGERDGLKDPCERMHRLLGELKIPHQWAIVPDSTHNPAEFFRNWRGDFLGFYAKAFAAAGVRPRKATAMKRHVYKQTPQGELAVVVHLPDGWKASDKRAAIVFFFGGGWRSGTIEQFRPHAEYLASRGMVTARAEYRVRSKHRTTPAACVEDGKSAVRWLRANAAKLGVDPARIAAGGGSAGGHVAACTFTTTGLDADSDDASVSCKPNLLVLFNPVLDCVSLGDRIGPAELARRISPNHNLTRGVPAAILFYGTEDRFLVGGRQFVALSKKLGNTSELHVAAGQRHAFFNRSPWLERTIYLMDQLLARHKYLKGKPTVELPEGRLAMKLDARSG